MTSMISRADAPSVVVGARAPRVRRVPEYVSSAGQEAIELAALAGLHLDPWEGDVLADALGEREDGKWAAFEVGTVVPRQNGKDAILEARELAGAILFGEKLLIHSAHEQATASEHFLRLLALIEEAEFSSRLLRPVRGKGSEAILFRDGTRILFKTRTGGGGRGFTGDFVALNEAMILPSAFTGALVPTMAARSITGNPQLWYAGSAVDQQTTEHGVVLARLRNRAIEGAERVGYFEWSAPGEDPSQLTSEQLADPRLWAQANPGLGIRISLEHVANECNGALGPREFAVERLGVGDWPRVDKDADQVIDVEQWKSLADDASTPLDPVVFAFDTRPDRSISSISVAASRSDGLAHLEVVDRRPGTSWVAARAKELVDRHDAAAVVCDERSPAASLLPQFTDLGVDVETASSSELAQAYGVFIDAVQDATVRHRGEAEFEAALTAAVKGAARRPLGEAWAWSRKSSSVDISPLVACTLALWKLQGSARSVYEDRGLLTV